MTVNSQRLLLAAAGATAADGALYVDDVFSTYVYEGTGTTQPIDNGLDLSGEGGLVWIKRRDAIGFHWLHDTERGTLKYVSSHNTNAEGSQVNSLTAFNSDGFTLGGETNWNGNGNDFVSWAFRKAPGFFDVVTYTGNATTGSDTQTISHSLGTAPGFIVVKRLNAAEDWTCYHRSLGSSTFVDFTTGAQNTGSTLAWAGVDPTSTQFTVGYHDRVNNNGDTYVAYLFAHDDQSFGTGEDEAIIKCGSYTGSANDQQVDLGFEPQWLFLKNVNDTTNWFVKDNIRGLNNWLNPNTNGAEVTNFSNTPEFNSTGFTVYGNSGGNFSNSSANTYIYIAIRRPHKPPEAGTDVFSASTAGSGSTNSTGFNVDWAITKGRNGTSGYGWKFDLSDSFVQNQIGTNPITYAFSRAPGFFDVVSYTGTGSNQTINHNLGVAPELLIVKKQNGSGSWEVGSDGLTDWSYYITLNDSLKAYSQSNVWNSTAPTSSVFSVGTNGGVNGSAGSYIAYLFATLPGISKVGSYTGTGSNIGVDCGFTAGARFVLIKRTDSTGDWYVYDSTRGIVGGNDPYLLINSTAAEVTNTDYIDPLNSGFTVTSSAPAALNASGGTYLFLAIA